MNRGAGQRASIPDLASTVAALEPVWLLAAVFRLVGDALSDVWAALAVRAQPLMVLTGQGRSQVPLLAANGLDDVPVFNDLLEAAVWIYQQEGVPLPSQGLSMRASES